METLNSPKKASPEDWHNADIIAALRKAGWSFRRLSVHLGLAPTSLANVMQKPYPKMEKAVADKIGVAPWVIWPSRYNVSIDADGNEIGVPNRGAPGRKAGVVYDTGLSKTRNVKKRKAD
ncbi:MAG: helix-turn-helix domain-containing protein [Methylobacter sp.]|uniref:helix-turn-helix domain-containing protein n=1 Tax=Methylobacter sp. TaxID=2051955 RepID=UPI00272F1759|nr:helix-turn-helix domain-containing protein [Methylobacter sp.]MDP1664091.1 helix-turn-helix domain-containing protein [Methylobacter sp.]